MKKRIALLVAVALLLTLVGCDQGEPIGTVEIYTNGDLALQISNVAEVQTKIQFIDDTYTYEETIYRCYPGATLTVINADMTFAAHSDSHVAHARWGLYDIETHTRTVYLKNEMEPVLLDETTDKLVNFEGQLFLASFEFVE